MGLDVKAIVQSKNPYEVLGTGDALAENTPALNALSPEDKKSLAIKLILGCPDKDLTGFISAIEATRIPQDDTNTFHSVLYKACQVKKGMLSLSDPRKLDPHNFIIGDEFDADLYNEFNGLALSVVLDKEVVIAQRLALTTPPQHRNQVYRNISNMFPESVFSQKLAAAFELRRNIDDLLLGDNPEQFFNGRSFSVDTCLEFAGLFPCLLKYKEELIGLKLSALPPEEKTRISRLLELINSRAHDQSSPFRLISAAMTPSQQQRMVMDESAAVPVPAAVKVAPQNAPAAANPNSLFATNKPRLISTPEVDITVVEITSVSEEQREPCCRLF